MIITVLRKSLDGSVVENTLKYGCGALNIDATRISGEVPSVSFTRKVDYPQIQEKGKAGWSKQRGGLKGDFVDWKPNSNGRWPANFILVNGVSCGGSKFFKQFKKEDN